MVQYKCSDCIRINIILTCVQRNDLGGHAVGFRYLQGTLLLLIGNAPVLGKNTT
jgi:hypothetical protein